MRSEGEDIRAVGADVDLDAFRTEVRADIDRKREAGRYPETIVFDEEALSNE